MVTRTFISKNYSRQITFFGPFSATFVYLHLSFGLRAALIYLHYSQSEQETLEDNLFYPLFRIKSISPLGLDVRWSLCDKVILCDRWLVVTIEILFPGGGKTTMAASHMYVIYNMTSFYSHLNIPDVQKIF